MSDIVKRLREVAQAYPEIAYVLEQAALEIERLQEANRRLVDLGMKEPW